MTFEEAAIRKLSETDVFQISIDPGTTEIGVAISRINPDTGCVTVEYVCNINATRALKNHSVTYRERSIEKNSALLRMVTTQKHLRDIVRTYTPSVLTIESAFLDHIRNVKTYGQLYAAFTMIQSCIIELVPDIIVLTVPPQEAKKNIGALKAGTDKGQVAPALKKLVEKGEELILPDGFVIDNRTSHELDAIMLAVTGGKTIGK